MNFNSTKTATEKSKGRGWERVEATNFRIPEAIPNLTFLWQTRWFIWFVDCRCLRGIEQRPSKMTRNDDMRGTRHAMNGKRFIHSLHVSVISMVYGAAHSCNIASSMYGFCIEMENGNTPLQSSFCATFQRSIIHEKQFNVYLMRLPLVPQFGWRLIVCRYVVLYAVMGGLGALPKIWLYRSIFLPKLVEYSFHVIIPLRRFIGITDKSTRYFTVTP